ncbi:MAG: exosome complex RNA-binding protein Csl4 [Acidilobus sp.]
MSSQGSKKVTPGDVIASEEEFVEGDNVFLDKSTGLLRASVVGTLRYDMVNRYVSVQPSRLLRAPKKGSLVVGMVTQVRESLAFAELYGEVSLEPRPRWVKEFSGRLPAVITVEQLSDSKVDDIYAFIRPTDVIVGRVQSLISPYLLSLKGPQLGVIYAFCSRCGSLMNPEADGFRCPRCGNFEKRKISNLAYVKGLKLDVRRIGVMIP